MAVDYQEILDRHQDLTAAIRILEHWLLSVAVVVGAGQAGQWPTDSTADQVEVAAVADQQTPVLRDKPLRAHNHLPVEVVLVVGDIQVDSIQTCQHILVQVAVVLAVLATKAEMADLLQAAKVV
jgi:hypothetical protein